ncbi:MAG: PAS domain-containing protein [Alphaproteobacteria bacterium]|nr:PAS domain-containing protein [Alphaproteobacteria bacterium]
MTPVLQPDQTAPVRQTDLPALFEAVCRQAVRETDSTRASIWYFESDGSLTCQCLFDSRDGTVSAGVTLPHAMYAPYLDAIRTNGIVMAPHARQHPATACFNDVYFPANDIHALLDFLVTDRDGQPAAVLCCEQCGSPRNWSPADVAALQTLALRLSDTFRYDAGTPAQRALFKPDLPFADEPLLMEAAIYWSAKRSSRQMPLRSDLSPIDMPRRLLPNLMIAEFSGEPAIIRYRLMGTAMVEAFGEDFTGRTTADISAGEYLAYIEGLYHSVRDTRAPVYSESTFRWDTGGWRHTRRLMLPLALDETDTVRQILVAQVWPRIADIAGAGMPTPQGSPILADRIDQGISQRLTLPQLGVKG